MPLDSSIKKVLMIGSGPIVIGQAAEFDYAGAQACRVLKEAGADVVLVNSNPATIMTDRALADEIYLEPLTVETVKRIIKKERPDSLLAGLGGQTGLTLASELYKEGFLERYGVRLIGTNAEAIDKAEDRQLFKLTMEQIGEPTVPSDIACTLEDALAVADRIGYPVIIRPAFTLGGAGGGVAHSREEMTVAAQTGLDASPISQILVERYIYGWKEIEFETMRDAVGNAIAVCSMENFDPVGIHTGDSIVVAPALTLSDKEYQMLRSASLRIISALGIVGGCNCQFALNPDSFEYSVIEVNPRVSRSSALASKASGYPIARVTAKIAVGMTLAEIPVAGGTAAIAPSLDYIVAKFPRFPFDKFTTVPNTLGTQMKATGEVMGIGSTLEECFLKSVRSLEIGVCHLRLERFDSEGSAELLSYVSVFHDDNIYAIAELLRRGESIERLHKATMITELFLECIARIVDMEKKLAAAPNDLALLREAKVMGFSDKYIALLWNLPEIDVYKLRRESGIIPAFRMVDTLHTGSYIAYLYSSYTGENQSRLTDKKKIVVLGAGPIRIGQGVEFDYSTVHAVQTIRRAGYEAIIINNNPETVSTDYTTSDKLYFEPLTPEDVMAIIDYEQPDGVIASLGGQTAINLAQPLAERGVKIIGTDCDAIERAENRKSFERILRELGIPQPQGRAVTNVEDGIRAAAEIGYPVLVRPSFVLGGRAMEIVANEEMLRHYLKTAVEVDTDKPVLVDHYIQGKEVEVDAVCDGHDVFVPGIMELVERTGVHSGDSISVYPSYSISDKVKGTILGYAKKLGLGIGIVGLYNIQFIVDEHDDVYIIEVNPRSSRTVPFLSKATGYSLADIATDVILGKSLKEQGIFGIYPDEKSRHYVKAPVFSSGKLKGLDFYLSPEMKSTGEAIGYDRSLSRAMYKALQASGMKLQNYGTVVVTLADEDKEEALPMVRSFYNMGFNIAATVGTAEFLKKNGIRTHKLGKISEGSNEILDFIRSGFVSYVINTRAISSGVHYKDGGEIRRCATENGVTIFTSLDTVRIVTEVLEEMTISVSTIDAE